MAEINVFINIAKNSNIVYNRDEKNDRFICEKITKIIYPFNFGIIPRTLGIDGKPINVLLLMESIYSVLIPGCFINCVLLGFLEVKDYLQTQQILIASPSSSEIYNKPNKEVDTYDRKQIHLFYSYYKPKESINSEISVDVSEIKPPCEAIKIYEEGLQQFMKRCENKDIHSTY